MKLSHVVFFFLFSIAIKAQSIATLNYGTIIAIDEVDIEFVQVLEDSRCPVNVNCIQAGKAVVVVNVYVQGNFIEERKLEFYPSGFSNEKANNIFNVNGLRITGLNLLPYPVALSKTPEEDYFLELALIY